MFGDLNKYLAVFLTGFVVTYLLTPVARSLARRYGIVDMPNARRPHKVPTARGGGIAVVLGVHAACLVALSIPWPHLPGDFDVHWWKHFLAASMVLLVVGLVDDIRGMKPVIKLGGQIVAAILVCETGTKFGKFFGIEFPRWLDAIFVVVWLLAIINAFNLIDGLDGLASGLSCISAAGLCGIFLIQGLPGNAIVLIGLIGACIAFLRYNLHPASIFLGDTGSMFLGFMLGLVSLQTCTKNTFILSMTIPMLVIGVPVYDTLLAIWRRSVRMWLSGKTEGKRSGIMQPDVDHLHHRLVRAGFSTRRVATLLCAGNAALVVFGLLITTFQSHAVGIFLIALLGGAYVLMRHLAILELKDTGAALLRGLRRPTHITFKALGYPAWDMFAMAGSLAVAMWLAGDSPVNFWHNWFLDLPVWVTPTFCLLALSRTYVTVWNRARMRDVLALALTLMAGLILSFGIAMLIDPYNRPQHWVVRALVVGGLSHPAILCIRILYWFVEELVNWSHTAGSPKTAPSRVVLYGSGGRCWIFLRELGYNQAAHIGQREIVGLIDDDVSLHAQWVYGYRVLGGRNDLPRMIEKYNLTGIVITALLTPESDAAVREIARKYGVELSEWRCEEQVVSVGRRQVEVLPKGELEPAPVTH